MPDIAAEPTPDPRPAIVICAWDLDETGWDPVEDLSGLPWNPPGARTVAVPADTPEALALTLGRHMGDHRCRALLLVGRSRRSPGFRLQMRAENRTLDGADRQTRTGPAVARATAPVAEIVRALQEAGLSADASSEAEDDAGSFILYHVLAGLADGTDTPAIGLLRAPADQSDAAVQHAVKTAAEAMTRRLSPQSRTRTV